MAKISPILNLSICLTVFYSLGACGTKAGQDKNKGNAKSESLRTEAFETFVKMAQLSCTYKEAEVISDAELAKVECENAAVKKKSTGQWKAEWNKTLSSGLTPLQFDSLCLNFTRVTSGEMPLPVSAKIQANAKKMAEMNEAAVMDLLKLAD